MIEVRCLRIEITKVMSLMAIRVVSVSPARCTKPRLRRRVASEEILDSSTVVSIEDMSTRRERNYISNASSCLISV